MLFFLNTANAAFSLLVRMFDMYCWVVAGSGEISWEDDFFLKNTFLLFHTGEVFWFILFSLTTVSFIFLSVSFLNRFFLMVSLIIV